MSPHRRVDPTHLDDHVRQCANARSPLHRLHCMFESLDGFVAPRFMTTLLLLVLLIVLLTVGLLPSA